MSSISTASLILFENMRVTRPMSKLAAQGSTAVIVRRPLSDRTTSVNSGAPLFSNCKATAPKCPPTKPAFSAPSPYISSFGFILCRVPRAPEERERLRKERLAFFRRCRAYQQRKYLPKFKLHRAPTNSYNAQYTREYVSQKAHFYRILPSPALLAPPATDYGGQVLDPDMFSVVPEIREHAPPKWDEWCPTRRPEADLAIDASMLFAPAVSSSGGLYPLDFARYFPSLWRKAVAEHNCEVRRANKERSSKVYLAGRRHTL